MNNPFLRRQRDYPRKLVVDIHSQCNARCRMCPYPQYAPQQSQGVMEWSLYAGIIDEFAALGAQGGFRPSLTYCYMAEPFVVGDLERYTAYAAGRGIEVHLNTNAAGMTGAKIDRLLASGFAGRFYISFHGATPGVYEEIMGLSYERSLGHIRYLLERYDPGKVCIRGVDDGWPPGERQRWRDMWRGTGVRQEYVRPISRCGSIERLQRRRLGQTEKVRLFGCAAHHPLVEMVILFDGRAVMCCQDMGREIIWGDVSSAGIAGVWNGRRRRQLVGQLYGGREWGRDFLCARCEQAITSRGELWRCAARVGWDKVRRIVRAAAM